MRWRAARVAVAVPVSFDAQHRPLAVAGVDVDESWGNPEGRAWYTLFHKEVTAKYKLRDKACFFAESRGMLMARVPHFSTDTRRTFGPPSSPPHFSTAVYNPPNQYRERPLTSPSGP